MQRFVFVLVATGCLGVCAAGEIADKYRDAATRVIQAARAGDGAYKKLEELCDDVGHRLSGSAALDKAIAWAQATMKSDGHENVAGEKVMIPKWVRGEESCVMVEPRRVEFHMLGLGGSVGTPDDGITAAVIAVPDAEFLQKLGSAVKGKIVLFDNPMPEFDVNRGTMYGESVVYRANGAKLAAEQGAIACLVRSVTARSLRSPHTGGTNYGDAKTKIPTAAISTEDAAMVTRLQKRGIAVKVTLKMQAREKGEVPSANVIGELRGREKPEEIVVIGGHLDSWDVGQGAHDDGSGCVTAMETITVLRKLNLRPRRTIRVVLFVNEENGLAGGKQYAAYHESELGKHVAAIEMDSGGFKPTGFGIDMQDEKKRDVAVGQITDVLELLAPIGLMKTKPGFGGADISPMKAHGVPLMGLDVDMATYFDYHHTHADTLDKVNPRDLREDVAAMAVMAYVLADMPGRLGEK